ncbi:hypothetical protein P7C70_g4974, partial [Phenoliferia sp. Uapishka_3]
MLKTLPRALSLPLPSLSRPLVRQISSASPSAPSVHDVQAVRKERSTKEVSAQHNAAALLQQAVQLTQASQRQASSSGPDSSPPVARRPRENGPSALPNAKGRWTETPKGTVRAPRAPRVTQEGQDEVVNAAPRSFGAGYKPSTSALATKLLEHRKKSGFADDAFVRLINKNQSAGKVAGDKIADDFYATPRRQQSYAAPGPHQSEGSDRQARPPRAAGSPAGGPRQAGGPRPPGGPGGPRQAGGPRKAGGTKKPFGRSASKSADPFADMPKLTFPSKVHYPTLDVASLIKADLQSRSLRLKAAVDSKNPTAKNDEYTGHEEQKAQRLAARKEQQGDYARWSSFGDAGKAGPVALEQARMSLGANPSFGLAQREKLLEEVSKALRK